MDNRPATSTAIRIALSTNNLRHLKKTKLQPTKMDPFAQQIQRIKNNDKVRELVQAFRLIPIANVNARNQLNESLKKILTSTAHKIPETQKKITEFTFNEPELSYHEIAARPKYRPMKHGIHYLDEDNTLYYNA
jgi:hypothetical protein